jgi:hypothetical protein
VLAYYQVYQAAKGGMAVDPAEAVIAPYRGLAVHCSLWSGVLYSSFFSSWGEAMFQTSIVWNMAFVLPTGAWCMNGHLTGD